MSHPKHDNVIQLQNSRDLDKEAKAQLDQLATRYTQEAEARKCASDVLRFASGDQISQIPRSPFEGSESFARRIKFSPNLLGFIIDKLALLYDESPTRTGEDEERTARWHDVSWDYGEDGLSAVLKDAEMLAFLTGTALVWRAYTPTDQGPRELASIFSEQNQTLDTTHAGIEGVVFGRHEITILPNREDPKWIDAVLVHIATEVVKGPYSAQKVEVFHFWNDSVWGVVEVNSVGVKVPKFRGVMSPDGEGPIRPVVEHHYGRLPFVPVYLKRPKKRTYGTPLGGRDLLANFVAIARAWTELAHTAMLQRGQPWYIGDSQPESNVLSPYALWHAKGTGTFGIASNAANIEGMLEVLSLMERVLAVTSGAPARSFRFESTQAESGVAIVADRSELEDWRQSRIAVMKRVEATIENIDLTVWDTHTAEDLGAATVAYKDWTPPKTNQERREQANAEWERNLSSPDDYLADTRPELSRDQVNQRIERATEFSEKQRNLLNENGSATD
jgi:hypothetical protein